MPTSDAALLLRDFVNTLDVDCAVDELGSPALLAGWLAEHRLLERPATPGLPGPAQPGSRRRPAGLGMDPSGAGEPWLEAALRLREGLRAALLSHQGAAPREDNAGPPAELEAVLARLPLRVSLAGPQPHLVSAAEGVPGALGALAAAIMGSVADGTWPRLKVCLEPSCRWAFVDTSKNRSRSWCSMRVCGNRTKTRAYRARQRS